MKLPSPELPRTTIELPSGKSVKIRPFIVSEQKMILNAIEMKDPTLLNESMDQAMANCADIEVKELDKLPVYDIEYLMIRLRSLSVSEVVKLNYICTSIVDDALLNADELKFNPNAEEKRGRGTCNTRLPVNLSLNSIEVDRPERDESGVIQLTDDMVIKLKDLTYGDYKKYASGGDTSSDTSLKVVASCLDQIAFGDNVYDASEQGIDDLVDWISSLTNDHFHKIDTWLKASPKVKHKFNLTCPSCGNSSTITLEGLDDFLA